MARTKIYYVGCMDRGYRRFESRTAAEWWMLCKLDRKTLPAERIDTDYLDDSTEVPVYEVNASGELFWMSRSKRWFINSCFEWTGEPDQLAQIWGD